MMIGTRNVVVVYGKTLLCEDSELNAQLTIFLTAYHIPYCC